MHRTFPNGRILNYMRKNSVRVMVVAVTRESGPREVDLVEGGRPIAYIGRCLNGFLGLSLTDRTILLKLETILLNDGKLATKADMAQYYR